jgi:hypothetical protein
VKIDRGLRLRYLAVTIVTVRGVLPVAWRKLGFSRACGDTSGVHHCRACDEQNGEEREHPPHISIVQPVMILA